MEISNMKLCYLTIAVFCCMHQFLSFADSTSNNSTPDYLENLLGTNNFKEFIEIVHIPNTDLVNPSQRKSLLVEQYFYNGLELGDILLRPGQMSKSEQEFDFNGHLKLSINKWKNGTVPYYISKAFSENQTDFIKNEIQYTNQKLGPNINFRPHQNGDNDYVLFFNGGSGCYSNLGNVGGPQVISLSEACFLDGFITHEMQHTLGIPHEQNRIDRDDYIGLKPENIPQVLKPQYEKYTSDNIVNTGPFAYYSIMMYPVKTPGLNVNAFELYQDGINESRLGAEKFLAPSDIQRVKSFYS